MRPVLILLVLVALGVAGLTAVLANRFLSDHQAAPTEVAAIPTEDVLVMATEQKPGAVLKPEDMHWQTWPAANLDGRLILRGADGAASAGFVGAVARRPLLPGEPLTADAVFIKGSGGMMAGILSPGMRAVSINVSVTADIAGFILPNDRVDVLLLADLRQAAGGNGTDHAGAPPMHFAAEVILADQRVLAVDEKLAKPDSGSNLTGHTVTLEVTPKDAELLATAGRLGELTLTLRSLKQPDPPEKPPVGYTTDTESSRALRAALGLTPADAEADGAKKAPVPEVSINRAGTVVSRSFPK